MRAASFLLIGCLLATSMTACSKAPPTPRQQLDALYKSADWLGSVDLSTKLLQESPDDKDLLYYRAQSYLALKMYDESIADYTQMIQIDPENSDWYFGRELAYERSGQTDLANADGIKGRELDLQYKTAYPFESRNFDTPSGVTAQDMAGRDSDGEEADSDGSLDDSTDSPDDETADSIADTEGSNRLNDPWDDSLPNDFGADEGVYDPINEAASILDRAMSEPSAVGSSVAGTPKVAEQLEQSEADAEFAEELARRAGNLADNVADSVADNKADNRVELDKEIADFVEQRLKKAKEIVPGGDAIVGPKEQFIPDEPTPMPENIVVPPRPTISTSLPTGPIGGAAPGAVRPLGMPTAPRTTGIISNPTVTALPTTANGSLGIPGIAGTPQRMGVQPGQFQGNTIYGPGSPRPTLSTSLPGTSQQIPNANPGFVPQGLTNGAGGLQRRGPVLSTQLPANRAITPGATARPTGIISGSR